MWSTLDHQGRLKTSISTNRHHFHWPIHEWCVGVDGLPYKRAMRTTANVAFGSISNKNSLQWMALAGLPDAQAFVPFPRIRSFLTFRLLFYIWLSKIQTYFPTSSPSSNTGFGRPNLSHQLFFCIAHELKYFYFFKWLKKIQWRIIFWDTWKLYKIQISMFIKFY